MFCTTLDREYAAAASLLGLDEVGVAGLADAAVRASFAQQADKVRILQEIRRHASRRRDNPSL